MNEDEFWLIIEKAGNPNSIEPDEQCENIIEILETMDKQEIVDFSNIHRKILVKSYTWPMIKASYVLTGFASDDGFQDFQNWVILNGKDKFYKTLESPDYLAEYISVQDPIEETTGESLLYVCEEAWDGDIEDLEEQYIYPEEPTIDEDIPEKDILIKEFPNIHAKYRTLDHA